MKAHSRCNIAFPGILVFVGTQARVRNIHGKGTIIVRATEVLLSFICVSSMVSCLYPPSNQGIKLSDFMFACEK